MAIGSPSKLSHVLIQRLDTMLGANIGQQSFIGPAQSPKIVHQADSPDNLPALKNPREQDLVNKDLKQPQPDKALKHMGLDNLPSYKNANITINQSAPTTLGQAARIILALFNKFPEPNHSIQGQKPLITHGQTLTSDHIARNLGASIKNSGLFYESQLVKLIKAEINLESLREQVQAKFTSTQNLTDDGISKPTSNTEQLQNIVRQQLEVLANQSFIWKGEAWPGAEMQCEFNHYADDETEPTQETEKPKTWSSKLNLKLPALGAINAKIILQGDKLSIQINAPESAKVLNQSADKLMTNLSARGLQTENLTINSADDGQVKNYE